jgi:hypothetical protein
MTDERVPHARYDLVRRFQGLGDLARLCHRAAGGRLRGGTNGMLVTTAMRQEWHAYAVPASRNTAPHSGQ